MIMHMWFECKVSFQKVMENGIQKMATESYLVDALSFTEAEARIIEEVRPFISGEFTVADVGRRKFAELFFDNDGDRFYKANLYFITLDQKSGSEKKTSANILVQAKDVKSAIYLLEARMKETMIDYSIASVAETKYMDVFLYKQEKQ